MRSSCCAGDGPRARQLSRPSQVLEPRREMIYDDLNMRKKNLQPTYAPLRSRPAAQQQSPIQSMSRCSNRGDPGALQGGGAAPRSGSLSCSVLSFHFLDRLDPPRRICLPMSHIPCTGPTRTAGAAAIPSYLAGGFRHGRRHEGSSVTCTSGPSFRCIGQTPRARRYCWR